MRSLKEKLRSKEEELSEFQESSRELEAELETQLLATEKRYKDLKCAYAKIAEDNDRIRLKLSSLTSEYSSRISELTSELRSAKETIHEMSIEKRSLEQTNDRLENTNRAIVATLEDFKKKFNEQLEKNVLLESEIDEKDKLVLYAQRQLLISSQASKG